MMTEFYGETCKSYQRVYELYPLTPLVRYPRTPGYREQEDDSWSVLDTWYYTYQYTSCVISTNKVVCNSTLSVYMFGKITTTQ